MCASKETILAGFDRGRKHVWTCRFVQQAIPLHLAGGSLSMHWPRHRLLQPSMFEPSELKPDLTPADEGDDGTNGWDMVERPGGWSMQPDAPAEGPSMSAFILPPPPSEPELVSPEHCISRKFGQLHSISPHPPLPS